MPEHAEWERTTLRATAVEGHDPIKQDFIGESMWYSRNTFCLLFRTKKQISVCTE